MATPKLLDLTIVNILDDGFTVYENDYFKVIKFPAGEISFKLKPPGIVIYNSAPVKVNVRITSSIELMLFIMTLETLKQEGINRISANLFKFPYAQGDKKFKEGEGIDLKAFVRIVNSYQLDKVYIFDPHSPVLPALLDNNEVVSSIPFMTWAVDDIKYGRGDKSTEIIPVPLVLLSPDAGAYYKVGKIGEILNLPTTSATKIRDVSNGAISKVEVGINDFHKADILVVDDICLGGRTFIELAKALEGKNHGNLWLSVSHGVFNQGFNELAKYYKGIYTTDSFRESYDSTIVKTYNLT